MLQSLIFTMIFSLSSFAHAQSAMGCWSFPGFARGEGIHELKLNILPALESDRAIHLGELTITVKTVDAKGRISLMKHPTGYLTCVPQKDGRNALNCYGEDDRGKIAFRLLDDGEARIEIRYLNTIVEDEDRSQKQIGLILVASKENPYVATTRTSCKKK